MHDCISKGIDLYICPKYCTFAAEIRKCNHVTQSVKLTTKQQQMKKKLYQKPTMKVIKLQPQAPLLAGSAGVNDYTWHDEEEE
jgi:hypothetical protein